MSAATTIGLSRRLIRIFGQDSSKFLQGLITNDIHKSENQAIYSGFLNHKGRLLFDGFIYQTLANEFVLDVDQSVLENCLVHLKKYKLRSQLEIEADRELCVSAILSSDPEEISRQKSFFQEKGILAFEDPRLKTMGIRVLHKSKELEGNAPESVYQSQRMWFGLPSSPNEIISGKSLPLECNLEWSNAISYTKGCYLGQELTARTHYTGVIRKRITPILLSTEQFPRNTVEMNRLPLLPFIPPSFVASSLLNHQPQIVSENQEPAISVIHEDSNAESGKLLSFSPEWNLALALLRVDHFTKGARSQFYLKRDDSNSNEKIWALPFIPSWWKFDSK
jgi:folate-binding protein YgfZ